jgi:type II secretory pathway component PulK
LPLAGRNGVAAIWTVVVLAVVSSLSAAAVAQFASARKQIDVHRNRIQADLLARAGYELALSRILTQAKDFPDETITPIKGGEIEVKIRREKGDSGIFRIESVARYPKDERGAFVQTLRRTVKRVEDSQGVRIEPASTD